MVPTLCTLSGLPPIPRCSPSGDTICTVQWYSSDHLFRTLLTLWSYMVHVAEEEELRVADVNEKMKANLG
jgi:hypothetical protein